MKIYNNFFYDYLDINPELGSFIGNRNYDEYYSISISEEYRNKYYSLCNKYLNKLQKDKNIWRLVQRLDACVLCRECFRVPQR